MELKLGIGIGELKFGMTQAQCCEILGAPSRVIEDKDRDEEIILEFTPLKIRLSFYKEEEEKLGYIRTANKDITYNNQRLVGQSIHSIKHEVFKDSIDYWDKDEYAYFNAHSNDENWLTLNEEYKEVTDIELGVPINDDDEYVWPS